MTDKPSAWIRWPGYIAWCLLALLPVSVFIVRSGNWKAGLGLYALASLLSLVVLALLAIISLLPRFSGQRGSVLKRALPAVPGAAMLLMALSNDVPPIHDITTDVNDPPVFEAAVELRGSDSNSLEIKPDFITQQQEAYPELRTLRSPRSYASSYNLSLVTAQQLGWEITRQDANAGFIEAIDTTAIMNFKDDIVIRVRTNDEGSLVDLRSVSRVGQSDLGANAKRITAFADAFAEAAANQ